MATIKSQKGAPKRAETWHPVDINQLLSLPVSIPIAGNYIYVVQCAAYSTYREGSTPLQCLCAFKKISATGKVFFPPDGDAHSWLIERERARPIIGVSPLCVLSESLSSVCNDNWESGDCIIVVLALMVG